MTKFCSALLVTSALFVAPIASAQTAEEPLFKQVIADEAQEQIEKEKARAAAAAAAEAERKKKAAAAAAARRQNATPRRPARTNRAPRPAAPRIVPLTAAERQSVVDRFENCYRAPRALRNAGGQSVEIVVKLSKEGFLTSSPLLVRTGANLSVAEEAYRVARKALFSCQPFVLPVEKYQDWKEVNLTLKQREVTAR